MSDDEPKIVDLQKRLDRQAARDDRLQDTDIANARRFVAQHSDSVRWTPERGWYVWDGRIWQTDDLGRVMVKARDTVESIYDEIRGAIDEDVTFRWAKRSQSAKAIRDMIYLAQSDPKTTSRLEDFDADPWLLNCENGVIDLRTGKLKSHDPALMCSRMVFAQFDPNARSDMWQSFLARITDGNAELQECLQRAVGYSLTGMTAEQCLFFCFGFGANGKSVFLETLQRLFGEYALNTRSETITARKNSGIPNDVARLAGARLVAINETAEGQALDEPLIKDMTGGDTMTARFLHKEFFDFRPNFKLWLRGNHKPQIKGTDDGIWRRIWLVPFEVTIPDNERDTTLTDKLAEELPGILAWAVQGCLDWQTCGLTMPTVITVAVKQYRTESDILGQFLDDCCEVTPNSQVAFKSLYGAYLHWAGSSGESPINKMRFGLTLTERGFTKKRGRAGIIYHGIRLLIQDAYEAGV